MTKRIEIQPGTPEFNKIVFKLNRKITPQNISTLNYDDQQLSLIQNDVYIMPAYINSTLDFNLFFIVAKLVKNDWIIAFAQASINDNHEIIDLSKPIPTGAGLNKLGEYSSEKANHILKYFNTLIETEYGNWRLIQ